MRGFDFIDNFGLLKIHESRLDANTSRGLKDEVTTMVNQGKNRIILDFSDVRFLDSSGLGVLVSLLKLLRAPGELVLCEIQDSSIQDILSVCRALNLPNRKRVTFEYILIAGINDSHADADKLCKLLQRVKCKVNLITFNPHAYSKFKPSNTQTVEEFKKTLISRGIHAVVRESRGSDIMAACGMLKSSEKKNE